MTLSDKVQISENITCKSLELTDKPIFDQYLSRNQYNISELTFANLFMWRESYKFEWFEYENRLFLVSIKCQHHVIAFPPLGEDPVGGIRILLQFAAEVCKDLVMIRVPEELITEIKKADIPVEITEDRDNWDYVYLRADLINLPGKDYQGFRRKVNKFRNRYNWKYEPITPEIIEECFQLQEKWCRLRACDDDSHLIEEHHGIRDVFDNWYVLHCEGGILRVDGKIVAYTFYDPFNSDTYVCHVEKGDGDYIGVYQVMAQEFLDRLPQSVKYINREQDLGQPNLRRAKESYHPLKYVKKSILEFSGERSADCNHH